MTASSIRFVYKSHSGFCLQTLHIHAHTRIHSRHSINCVETHASCTLCEALHNNTADTEESLKAINNPILSFLWSNGIVFAHHEWALNLLSEYIMNGSQQSSDLVEDELYDTILLALWPKLSKGGSFPTRNIIILYTYLLYRHKQRSSLPFTIESNVIICLCSFV